MEAMPMDWSVTMPVSRGASREASVSYSATEQTATKQRGKNQCIEILTIVRY